MSKLSPEQESLLPTVKKTPATSTLRSAQLILLRTLLVFMTIQALYFAYKFLFQLEMRDKIKGKKDAGPIYVVMSSDTNMHYLLAAPFAVQFWLNMNITSIMMLCGTEEEYQRDTAAREVVSELRRLGAVVLFFKNQKLKSANFAQNMRNYAAATSFVQQNLDNNTMLVTSDVDYFPFRLKDHIPNLGEGKEIAFFNPNCCAPIRWKKDKFRQYPMGTIAMTVKWWKEVIDIHPHDIADGPYIEAKTDAVFDHQLFLQSNTVPSMWFLDQQLFGLQFGRMTKRNKDYERRVTAHSAKKRLDRKFDWAPQNISNANLEEYDDAHIDPAIYDDEVWQSTREFYKKILTEEQMKPLEAFRDHASKFVNATLVATRHYHPG